MITSYHGETWDLMNRGTDRETGLETCHVRRRTVGGGLCIWRLVKLPDRSHPEGRWRNIGTMVGSLPSAGFRPAPERRGKLLCNSRTDLMLLSFAQHGHGSAYA